MENTYIWMTPRVVWLYLDEFDHDLTVTSLEWWEVDLGWFGELSQSYFAMGIAQTHSVGPWDHRPCMSSAVSRWRASCVCLAHFFRCVELGQTGSSNSNLAIFHETIHVGSSFWPIDYLRYSVLICIHCFKNHFWGTHLELSPEHFRALWARSLESKWPSFALFLSVILNVGIFFASQYVMSPVAMRCCADIALARTRKMWVGIDISGLEGPTIGYFSKLRKPCHTILVAGSKFLNQVFADNFSSMPFLTESLKKPGPRRI